MMSEVAQAARERSEELMRSTGEDFGPMGLEVFGLSGIDALRLYSLEPGYSDDEVERRCQALRDEPVGDLPYQQQATWYLLLEIGRKVLLERPSLDEEEDAGREPKQSQQGALYFLGLPDDYSLEQLDRACLMKKYAPLGVSVRSKPDVFRAAVEDSREVLARALRS